MTRTSNQGCPNHNYVSGQIWYLQVVISFNIVIITDIYITSDTPVTIRFWSIFVQAWQPEPLSAFANDIFIDSFHAHNSMRAIDALPSAKMRFYDTVEHPDI